MTCAGVDNETISQTAFVCANCVKKSFVLVSCYDNVFLWSVSGYTEY